MKDSCKQVCLRTGLLLFITFVTYLPALRNGFIWDDDYHVTNNQLLRTAPGLAAIWLHPGALPQYYPLVHTGFWIEYHLWGLDPFGYHLVNVLLQALNALLLWRVLDRLRLPGAWLAAAIFAVHPVQVESVAWITERKNLLSTAFYLLALLAYGRFCLWWEGEAPAEPLAESAPNNGSAGASPSPADRQCGYYLLALGLFVCALLSKTVACTLPAAILLLLWWKRGRIGRPDVWPLAPFFAAGAALGLATVWIEKHLVGAAGPEWSLTMADRLLIAGRALWFYAAKLAWPSDLVFIYPRWSIDAGVWRQWLFPAAAIGAALALWTWRARLGRGPVAAVLFFAGTLAPALGFVDVFPMRYSYVADHFQYLASIGLIALAAAGLTVMLRNRTALIAVAAPVLIVLSALSGRHCRAFRDPEALWRDTLEKNPGCSMARNNLAIVLSREGRLPEAVQEYEELLRLSPDDAQAHSNLGFVLMQQGKPQEAAAHFERALRITPDSADAHYNLGLVLAQQGNLDDAIARFRQALRLRPDFAEARAGLGNALVRQSAQERGI